MGYRDQMLECSVCGSSFIFPVDEQRRMMEEQGGIEVPTTCPSHRHPQQAANRRPAGPAQAPAAGPDEAAAEETMAEGGPHHGRVKWFDARKGYGFLVRDDGREVFVHYSGLEGEGFRTLYEGQEVEFQIEQTPRGPQAINVVKLSLAPQDSSGSG